MRYLIALSLLLAVTSAHADPTPPEKPMNTPTNSVAHLQDFPVIEFRRYTLVAGKREAFVSRFEAYFPEAFQQLGALALGQFCPRDEADGMVWMRGFKSMEARGIANAAFYYGPVWGEHAPALNAALVDHTNVLLLQPYQPARGVPVLPSVDPVREPQGATGIAVAQIFAVQPGQVHVFAAALEIRLAGYRAAGAREAGLLVTLDAKNTFPQLTVRSDGPWLVWLGLVENETMLQENLLALLHAPVTIDPALLRAPPELLVLHPTPRSRLRWLP